LVQAQDQQRESNAETVTVILQHLMTLPPNSTSGTPNPVFDVLSCDDVRV